MSEITERLEQRITDLAGEGMTHLQQVNGHAPLGGPDPECGNCDSIYGELYILRDALAELRTLQQQRVEIRFTPRLLASLNKTVTGMLLAFINDHGPLLDGSHLGSAAKRIAHGVFGLLKTHPDIRRSEERWRDLRCEQECSIKARRIDELEAQLAAISAEREPEKP